MEASGGLFLQEEQDVADVSDEEAGETTEKGEVAVPG